MIDNLNNVDLFSIINRQNSNAFYNGLRTVDLTQSLPPYSETEMDNNLKEDKLTKLDHLPNDNCLIDKVSKSIMMNDQDEDECSTKDDLIGGLSSKLRHDSLERLYRSEDELLMGKFSKLFQNKRSMN